MTCNEELSERKAAMPPETRGTHPTEHFPSADIHLVLQLDNPLY